MTQDQFNKAVGILKRLAEINWYAVKAECKITHKGIIIQEKMMTERMPIIVVLVNGTKDLLLDNLI